MSIFSDILVPVDEVADDATLNLNDVWSVTTHEIDGTIYVYVAGAADDGISVFSIDETGALTLEHNINDTVTSFLNGVTQTLVFDRFGTEFMMVSSRLDDAVNIYSIEDDGNLTFVSAVNDVGLNLDGTAGKMSTVKIGVDTYLIVTGGTDDGFSIFELGFSGGVFVLNETDNVTDSINLDFIYDSATIEINGTHYLYTASFNSDSISGYEISAGGIATNLFHLSDAANPNLDLNGVVGLATGTIGTTNLLFSASLNDDTVSVFTIDASGALTEVFSIADTAILSLDGAHGLEFIEIDDAYFLAVTGRFDQAVSFFHVAESGTLTLIDDASNPLLNNALYVAHAEVDGNHFLISGGEFGDGIVSLKLGGTDDTLTGGVDDDILLGFDGDDILDGGLGDDYINGGAGEDWLDLRAATGDVTAFLGFSSPTSASFSPGYTNGALGNDALYNIENIYGSNFADNIFGSNLDNIIHGNDGDDVVQAQGGNDTLFGHNGADRLFGQAGDDYIDGGAGDDDIGGGEGDDTLIGGEGNDDISGGGGITIADGGAGNDTYDLQGYVGDVTIDIGAGTTHIAGDSIINFENVQGGDGNDHITGTDGNNILRGGEGNNIIYGLGGNDGLVTENGDDLLFGGDGDDFLWSRSGTSLLDGGAGDDSFWLSSDALQSTIIGGAGYDDLLIFNPSNDVDEDIFFDATGANIDGVEEVRISGLNDTIIGNDEIEVYISGGGNDTITTGNGDNVVSSRFGNDVVTTGSGVDTVFLGDGNDIATLGDGNDVVKGDDGDDNIDGGSGYDLAIYNLGITFYYISTLGGVTTIGATSGNEGTDVVENVEVFRIGGREYPLQALTANYMPIPEDDTTFAGTSGADIIIPSTEGVDIDASGGDDFIYTSLFFTDDIDGGSGFDTVVLTANYSELTITETAPGTFEISGGSSTGGGTVSIVNVEALNFIKEGVHVTLGGAIDLTTGNDVFDGNATDEIINGLNGDDIISGGAGGDTIDGGGGIDAVNYANSNAAVLVNLTSGFTQGGHAIGDILVNIETLLGSNFDDRLSGDAGDNRLEGSFGNDILNGSAGDDILNGGDGDDTLNGGAGSDVAVFNGSIFYNPITKNGGIITVTDTEGNGGTDTLTSIENVSFTEGTFRLIMGTEGNDAPLATTGADLIFLNGGDDSINASNGDDYIFGGDGSDTIIGGNGADYIDGGAGYDQARYANSNEAVTVNLETGVHSGGHAEGDTLVGIADVFGSGFDDVLTGNEAKNVLTGFNGNDVLNGGMGDDTLIGGNGDDTLIGGFGADFNNGGAGFGDVIDYSGSYEGVQARLGGSQIFDGGFATGDSFRGIEDLIGSAFNDTLVGNVRANVLTGNDGDDFINGDRGNDTLLGGAGNDTIVGGLGQDTIDGGDGVDELRYANANSRAVVDLSTGQGTAGHSFGDSIINVENLFGSQFNDVFIGDAGDNVLNGWNGVDRLTGGEGNDTLIGGAGNDRFIFTDNWDNDTISDFEDGNDLMDFRTVTGVDDISDLAISTDANGDAVITFGTDTITLTGIDAADLDAADFLF